MAPARPNQAISDDEFADLMTALAPFEAAPRLAVAVSGGADSLALTVLAVAWVAGRIYKVGILMAGKRPTLPELIRWVREA